MSNDWTNIEVIERYASLWEIYGSLLSERQAMVIPAFFFEDLSLAEIADQIGISRQAVHEHLLKGCSQLDEYERHLKIHAKRKKNRDTIKSILSGDDLGQIKTSLQCLIETI